MTKALMILGIAFVLVAALIGVMYTFGTPQTPATVAVAAQPAVDSQPAAAAPEVGTASTSSEVPEADPSSPLAIQIPGCVCHSKDPKLVKEHAKYRMNQCYGCHKEGTPAMGQ